MPLQEVMMQPALLPPTSILICLKSTLFTSFEEFLRFFFFLDFQENMIKVNTLIGLMFSMEANLSKQI